MIKKFKTLGYFKNTRYISITALIAALMIVVGSITVAIPWFKLENSVLLQLADAIFLPLIILVPGPSTLIAAIIFGVVIDSIAGYFIVIPATVIIRVLIFFGVKLTHRVLRGYGSIILWYLLIFLYVGYNGIINGLFSEETKSTALNIMKIEAITDSVQYISSVIIALALYNILSSSKFKAIFVFDFIEQNSNTVNNAANTDNLKIKQEWKKED